MSDTTTHGAYALARLAECAGPDSESSPGAKFLVLVEDSFIEAVEYDRFPAEGDEWPSDVVHEIADGCVPVYTHDRWVTFVDLAAYQEDVSELAGGGEDMTTLAAYALYQIAYRLAAELLIEREHAGSA